MSTIQAQVPAPYGLVHRPMTDEEAAAYPNYRLTLTGPISGPNQYWFRPDLHWHEVTKEAAGLLKRAGYGFK